MEPPEAPPTGQSHNKRGSLFCQRREKNGEICGLLIEKTRRRVKDRCIVCSGVEARERFLARHGITWNEYCRLRRQEYRKRDLIGYRAREAKYSRDYRSRKKRGYKRATPHAPGGVR